MRFLPCAGAWRSGDPWEAPAHLCICLQVDTELVKKAGFKLIQSVSSPGCKLASECRHSHRVPVVKCSLLLAGMGTAVLGIPSLCSRSAWLPTPGKEAPPARGAPGEVRDEPGSTFRSPIQQRRVWGLWGAREAVRAGLSQGTSCSGQTLQRRENLETPVISPVASAGRGAGAHGRLAEF